MSLTSSVINDFKDQTCFRIDESARMIEKSLKEIDENELWQKPNSSLNSIGNLLLHLCGNITQYVIAGVGGVPDERQRDLEFSVSGGYDKNTLLAHFNETLSKAKQTIVEASESSLVMIKNLQGFQLTGQGAILHAVEHLSYHTGQIAFWVKLLKDKDLGFYSGINLNERNS